MIVDATIPAAVRKAVLAAREQSLPVAVYATGGSFLNWLPDPARTHTAYTAADYSQQRAVKATYDPDRVFTPVKAIPPAVREAAAVGA